MSRKAATETFGGCRLPNCDPWSGELRSVCFVRGAGIGVHPHSFLRQGRRRTASTRVYRVPGTKGGQVPAGGWGLRFRMTGLGTSGVLTGLAGGTG